MFKVDFVRPIEKFIALFVSNGDKKGIVTMAMTKQGNNKLHGRQIYDYAVVSAPCWVDPGELSNRLGDILNKAAKDLEDKQK